MNERDLDAEFARIVARWDDLPADALSEAPAPDPLTEIGDGASDGPDAGHDDGPGASEPGQGPSPTLPTGSLGVPIAPTTAHVWRGEAGRRDDAESIIARAPTTDDSVDTPDGDHFVPPSNPDLPTAEDDPMYWAIVVGLGGGPLLLLYLLFFDREGSGWWVVTAIGMTVVGFVLMVLRGGTERDPTDDGIRL